MSLQPFHAKKIPNQIKYKKKKHKKNSTLVSSIFMHQTSFNFKKSIGNFIHSYFMYRISDMSRPLLWWEGSGVTGGGGGGRVGRVPPRDFWLGNFCLTYREERGKEKRENGARKKEDQKRESGKLIMEGGKVTKWGEDPFFFFSLLKPLNFFWVYQNGNFLPGKSILHCKKKKKTGKMTLPPLKNIPLTPLWEGTCCALR